VCFPQFSDRGPLPKHGFARTSRWELVTPAVPQATIAEARFQLDSSMSPAWEHAFCLVLLVRLGPGWIELELQAANTGRSVWDFTAALHTYLAVHDVREVAVAGLRGVVYEDMTQAARPQAIETSGAVRIAGEVDCVYRSVPATLDLLAGGRPQLRVTQQGFTDTVVWNPGPQKAAALGDLPAADWQRMLCVEAAVVHQPVHLAPGKTWRGTQRLQRP
jgi:glucose-6-phosphate 1-epimerase